MPNCNRQEYLITGLRFTKNRINITRGETKIGFWPPLAFQNNSLFSVLPKLCNTWATRMNSYLILLFLFINILFNYFRSTSRISAICAAFAGYGTGPPAAATSPSADDRPLQSIHTLPNTHTHYQTHTLPNTHPTELQTHGGSARDAGISSTFKALIMT